MDDTHPDTRPAAFWYSEGQDGMTSNLRIIRIGHAVIVETLAPGLGNFVKGHDISGSAARYRCPRLIDSRDDSEFVRYVTFTGRTMALDHLSDSLTYKGDDIDLPCCI